MKRSYIAESIMKEYNKKKKYIERRERMKQYKVETKFIKNTNYKGKAYEENEPITLDRAEYENLFARGFVAEGKKKETFSTNKLSEDK